MPKDLISVKVTKKERKENDAIEYVEPEYPYGMRLSFGPDISDRFPILKGLEAEEEVAIMAEGLVTEIRVNDRPGNSSRTVEIQITEINLVSKADYEAAFDEATKK